MSENAESTTYQQLTLLQGDSPVNPFPQPGSAEANRMTAISGLKCGASLLNSGPVGSLLKTCLESETFTWTRFYLTWKVWTTPQGRLIFRLSHSAPPTSGTGFSLLPTPTDPGKGGGSSRSGERINETPSLHGMARKGELALWPTPRQFMYKDSHIDRGKSNLGEVIGGAPNPPWVEWVMGFPEGYTEVE
jgi:hypothetical protein